MRLTRAIIEAYRSILREEFRFEPEVTVLVGSNECGKTNCLLSLQNFNGDIELSNEQTCQYSKEFEEGKTPRLILTFSEFTSEEEKYLSHLATHYLGIDKNKPTVKTPEKLNDTAQDADENQTKKDNTSTLVSAKKDSDVEIKEALRHPKSLTVIKTGPGVDKYTIHINGLRLDSRKEPQSIVTKKIMKKMPTFLYFKEISMLKGGFTVKNLIDRPEEFNTEVNLLTLGGITDFTVLSANSLRRARALKVVEDIVTNKIREVWKQDPTLKIHISIDNQEITIRLSDKTGVLDQPESRSPGFRWYLSFYIDFLAATGKHYKNNILLFDEPGIQLHPSGQKDLLAILDTLGKAHQVIYTTHSPFMINRNFPSRTRVLQKEGKQGTTVTHKPDINRLEPLRSSIGFKLGDSLFFGEMNMIVEGPVHQFILSGFSRIFAEQGLPYIDLNRVAIVSAGGLHHILYMAQVAHLEKRPAIILLDGDEASEIAKKKLLQGRVIELENGKFFFHDRSASLSVSFLEEEIVQITQAFEGPVDNRKTIEDLLPFTMYLDAVNAVYSEMFRDFEPIDIESFKGKVYPLCDSFNNVFKKRNEFVFDRLAVAKKIVFTLSSEKIFSNDGTPKRDFESFGRLFTLINSKLLDHPFSGSGRTFSRTDRISI